MDVDIVIPDSKELEKAICLVRYCKLMLILKENKTYTEIGVLLGKSESTIQRYIKRIESAFLSTDEILPPPTINV